MRHSKQTVDVLLTEWFAAFGSRAVRAASISNSQRVEDALFKLIAPPFTAVKVGRLLQQLRDELISEKWQLDATRDGHSEAWLYSVSERAKEGDALKVIEAIRDNGDQFEDQLDGLRPAARLKKIDKVLRQQERNAKNDRKDAQLAEESRERNAARVLESSANRARREMEAKAPAGHGFNIDPSLPLLDRMRAYREEAARLESDPNLQRIRHQLTLARHEPNGAMVATIIEIERLRGKAWSAGMSINPHDYRDYSSPRACAAAFASTSTTPLVRKDWSPFDI